MFLSSRCLMFFTFAELAAAQSHTQQQRRQQQQQVLGILGENVTFPAPVFNKGFLQYENIGNVVMILNGGREKDQTEKFRDRLQWDRQTGHFTISHLQTHDSGVYTVDSYDVVKQVTVFNLKVYDRVPKPNVSMTGRCSAVCRVPDGEHSGDVNLSWFRGTELMISSSQINYSLPLEVNVSDVTYSCVARNAVSYSTRNITLCTEQDAEPKRNDRRLLILVWVGFSGVAIIIIIVGMMMRKRMKQQHTEEQPTVTEEHIQYAEVTHIKTQKRRHHLPELGPSSALTLTTVYDELRPRRPSNPESEALTNSGLA